MMRYISVGIFLIGTTAVTLAAQAQQSKQTTLKVTATVVGNCLVTANDVAFGNYDPVGANATTPADADGLVEVTCTQGTLASIALDSGQNAQGQTRRMVGSAGGQLEYELYWDAGRTTRFSMVALSAAPSTTPRRYTVYGRLRQGQDQPIGNYLDTVVVTVSF